MRGTRRVRHTLKLLIWRRWRVGLVALLPVSALLAGVLTAAPASAVTTGTLIVSSLQTNSSQHACLDDWQGTQYNYNLVVAYACNANDQAQQWYIPRVCGGGPCDVTTTIQAVNAGGVTDSCLDVYARGTTEGTPVDLYPCNAYPNNPAQMWYVSPSGEIWNPNSGMCLDITGYVVTPPGGPPTQLDIWPCKPIGSAGQENQQWTLED